jgi:hypothetical protein
MFTVASRRSAFAVLAGIITLLTGWRAEQRAGAQRRRNVCRPLGGACFPERGLRCCGNAACRQGKCRCGRQQKVCGGRCISKQRCCRNRECGAGQRCQRGRCTGRCGAGKHRCGKRCVNLKSTNQHCGACGLACAGTATCKQGVCVAGGTYRVIRQWGADEMENPRGITVDRSGALYVADYQVNSRIWKFAGNATHVTSFPTVGGTSPVGIDFTPEALLYVTNIDDDTVQTYATNGTPRASFVTTPSPQAVAVGPSGDVYIVSIGLVNNTVRRFNARGDLVATWDGAPYDFDQPYWVATAPNGDVYVTDVSARRITWLSATGKIKGRWGTEGTGNGEFANPMGITVDTAGFVYVVDVIAERNARVQKFTATGRFVGSFSSPEFIVPVDVAVSRAGMVYVTDLLGKIIVQFAPA